MLRDLNDSQFLGFVDYYPETGMDPVDAIKLGDSSASKSQDSMVILRKLIFIELIFQPVMK